MVILILGLGLWSFLHVLRLGFPSIRQGMTDRFGAGSKGIVALGVLLSVALMIAGYRSAAFIPVWSPPEFLTHINNLLMVFAFYVYFTTATQPGTAFIMGNVKNPQMTGFKIWAFAHLLVNGDLASIVLFGGLLAWAVAQIVLSKKTVSLVDRSKAPISSPWVHLGLVIVVFFVVALVHVWLGYWPFGG